MSFSTNNYLNWYLPRASRNDNAVNLHSSGMPALDPGAFKPELGNPWTLPRRFEEALAHWLNLSAEEVVAAEGATGANLLALLALVPPGRQVWVEHPIYEPMLRQAQRTNPLRRLYRKYADRFQLPMDQLRSGIGPDTGAVVLVEPTNPGGVHAAREEVLEVADLLAPHGGLLILNEVYRGFTGRESFHGLRPNIVIVSSLSKLCGTYWMRVGWLSASTELCAVLRDGRLTHGTPTMLGCAYGLEVLPRINQLQDRAIQAAWLPVPTLNDWLENTPGLSWILPEGPGFATVSLPERIDDLVLAEWLHDQEGVLLIPGTMFGTPGALRLCWLQTEDQLERGLSSIEKGLKRFSERTR